MVEERITTVEGQPASATHHTTIIHDTPERRGSGTTMLIAIVLVIAVIAGVYLFSQSNSSEATKNNAVAGAANSVSQAADKIGAAAEDAADSVKK